MSEQLEFNNDDVILDLQGIYDNYGDLIKRIYTLFRILGVNDPDLIDEAMWAFDKKRESSYREQGYEKYDEIEIIKKLKKTSRIELDNYSYLILSEAYVSHQICNIILNKKKDIESDDISFSIDCIERIYSSIGIIYSQIMSEDLPEQLLSQKNIQSLGGKSRAKLYEVKKREVYEHWEAGKFHTYASCAKKLSQNLDLAPKTIEKWLSKKYS